ncbi:MAG: right-handed parallel beta-helix repeat-containing protein [Sumerlaeia bacterium]
MKFPAQFLIAAAISCFAMTAFAQDFDCPSADCVVVRQDGATTGSQIGVYDTIQAAILAAPSQGFSEILVYPGEYRETLQINQGGLTLRAIDGPLLTCINGADDTDSTIPVVSLGFAQEVTLIGFNIRGGGYGVFLSDSAEVRLQNCVVEGNRISGIYSEWTTINVTPPQLTVSNCVVTNNAGNGIDVILPSVNPTTCSFTTIQNSIVSENAGVGIYVSFLTAFSTQSTPNESERFQMQYNLVTANVVGNYGGFLLGIGGKLPIPATNASNLSVGFLDSSPGCGRDVRLRTNSQARNAGWPTTAFRDPDGSRNDLGVFGGPFAAGFFTTIDDGPVVKQVTPLGTIRISDGPFTIEAVGAAR